ncbi:hypothetical protein ACG7TL_008385 [Trametes sanguinea]
MDDPTATVKDGFDRCSLHALQALSPGFGCSGPSLLACVCKNKQFWKVALPYIEKTCGDVEGDRAAHVQHDLCASGHHLSASDSVAMGLDTDALTHPGGVPSYAMIFIGFGIGIVVLLIFGAVASHLGRCGTRHEQHLKDYISLSSTDGDATLVGHTSYGDAEEGSCVDHEHASGSTPGFVLARVHKSFLGHPLVVPSSQSSSVNSQADTQLDPVKQGDTSSLNGHPSDGGGTKLPPPYEAEHSKSVRSNFSLFGSPQIVAVP